MQRLSKSIAIIVGILLCLLILGYTALDYLGYENVDTLGSNLLVAAIYLALGMTAVIAIVKSRQVRLTYLLLAQHTLCLAAVSMSHGVFRGWYVGMKGYSILFVGYYDVPMEPEELYDEIGLLHLVRLPVPEWNWSVLLALSSLLTLLALGWFVRTIRRSGAAG